MLLFTTAAWWLSAEIVLNREDLFLHAHGGRGIPKYVDGVESTTCVSSRYIWNLEQTESSAAWKRCKSIFSPKHDEGFSSVSMPGCHDRGEIIRMLILDHLRKLRDELQRYFPEVDRTRDWSSSCIRNSFTADVYSVPEDLQEEFLDH